MTTHSFTDQTRFTSLSPYGLTSPHGLTTETSSTLSPSPSTPRIQARHHSPAIADLSLHQAPFYADTTRNDLSVKSSEKKVPLPQPLKPKRAASNTFFSSPPSQKKSYLAAKKNKVSYPCSVESDREKAALGELRDMLSSLTLHPSSAITFNSPIRSRSPAQDLQ